MFTEEAPVSQRSFFDDEDPHIKFKFQSPNDGHQKILNTPAIIRSTLMIKFPNEISLRKASLALHNHLLVQFINDTNTIPEQVLDVLHTKLMTLKVKEQDPKYGFSLTKNGNTFEFYCSDQRIMEDWFESLRSVCVLNSFHEDYKAIKMIGRGSFAKVYLVESKSTKKSYAVKAFTKDCMAVTNKTSAKPSLLNEIEIMRGLDHDNIIKLYEVYETDKSIYLVLELIQGKSLYDVLKRPNFRKDVTLTQIINMARSLLDALAYLASKGIMHRDLKPDNILLERGEKVKIVDFGLATFIKVPNYIFKKCGTPGYIAPEVFKYNEKSPNTNYDDRCDVFSVGCLFHYMLLQVPFFEGPSASDILRLNKNFTTDYHGFEKIKQELHNSSGVTQEGFSVLLDLLEYDQKKRVSANQALNHPFFNNTTLGMQKGGSLSDLSGTSLSKYLQNDLKSPLSPSLNSPTRIQPYSPMKKPLHVDVNNKENLASIHQDRYVREDSLYLDLGRPELNGRMDTIAAGSTTNSLLLANRPDSASNVSPTCIPSSFANPNSKNSATKKGSTGKAYNQGGQSFLKAAIFNTMQKNNSEGIKDEEVARFGSEGLKLTKTTSEFAKYSPAKRDYDDDDIDEVSNENAGIHTHFERIHSMTQGMHPSRSSHTKMGRFDPTSPKYQIPQKNGTFGDI